MCVRACVRVCVCVVALMFAGSLHSSESGVEEALI